MKYEITQAELRELHPQLADEAERMAEEIKRLDAEQAHYRKEYAREGGKNLVLMEEMSRLRVELAEKDEQISDIANLLEIADKDIRRKNAEIAELQGILDSLIKWPYAPRLIEIMTEIRTIIARAKKLRNQKVS